MECVSDYGEVTPNTHFARQLRKERMAHGWSVHELARRSGISAGHISHIENGKRNPTEKIAGKLDVVFPERKHWFSEYYRDSREWAPPGYRNWHEYEDRALLVRCWVGGLIHGLAQTPDYARAHLQTVPGVPPEIVTKRLAARMERQRRLYERAIPVWHLVDELSLYREMGTPEIMAGQCAHLLDLGRRPDVSVLVVPGIGHATVHTEVTVTDSAGYTEHMAAGAVYTDETGIWLRRLVDTLQGESYRVSESARIITEVGAIWKSGVNPLTAARQAGRASK